MEEEVNPKSKLPYGISAVSFGAVDGPSLENVKQKSRCVKWDGSCAEIIRLPVTDRELAVRLDQFIGIMYSILASSEESIRQPSVTDTTAPTAEKIQATRLTKLGTDKIGLVSGEALSGPHCEEEYGTSKRAS